MTGARLQIRTMTKADQSPGKQQPDPATYRPGQQPGQPIPVRPPFAPVGDGRDNAHHFSEDEKPQHMTRGIAGQTGHDGVGIGNQKRSCSHVNSLRKMFNREQEICQDFYEERQCFSHRLLGDTLL